MLFVVPVCGHIEEIGMVICENLHPDSENEYKSKIVKIRGSEKIS